MAQITNEEFKRLYKEFKKLNELGTDSEFADFLNKKGFRPIDKGGSKKFTDKNVFARRKLLNLKSFLKAGTQNPTTIKTREKRNKVLTDLVNKANQGDKYVSPAQLSYLAEKKLGIKPKYESAKNIDGSLKRYPKFSTRDTARGGKGYKVINQLETRADKIDKVIKDLLISDKPLNKQLSKHIIDKTGVTQPFFIKIRDQIPSYKAIKEEAERLPQFLNKANNKYLLKLPLAEQLQEVNKLIKGDPAYTYSAEGKKALKTISTARDDVMKYALRNWNQNRGQGDVKFYDSKNKLIPWEKGTRLKYGNISFEYNGKKYNTANLTPDVLQKDFSEVYNARASLNKLRSKKIPDPFNEGKTIPLEKLIRKIQVDGYQWSPSFPALDITHGIEGVKGKPFTDLKFNTKDINMLEFSLTRNFASGKMSEANFKKAMTKLNEPFVKGDVTQAIIDRVTKQAQNLKEGKFYGFTDLKNKIVDSFAQKVKSIPGGCRAVVTRALGGPIDACEAIIKADPKAAAVKLNNAITATKGPLNELKKDSQKLANFIDTGQITTADKWPRPDDAKLADTFKETNLRWNNDIGAFETTNGDIASQSDIKKYAADNPMEVKVGEEPLKAATNKSVLANVGKAMARVGAPLPTALLDSYFIGQQVKEGKGTAEIASNPLNWLGLATMEPLSKAAGIAEGGGLNKALRLGLNPATIRGITRFAGLPGLAVSTAMTAYDQYQKYKDGEGFIFNLLNQKGTE